MQLGVLALTFVLSALGQGAAIQPCLAMLASELHRVAYTVDVRAITLLRFARLRDEFHCSVGVHARGLLLERLLRQDPSRIAKQKNML